MKTFICTSQVKGSANLIDLLALAVALAIIGSLMVVLTSCTSTTYISPSGETFRRVSFGTKLAAQEITVTAATNGNRSLVIKGYANDQVQAIGVAVDAAVTAAVKSAKP